MANFFWFLEKAIYVWFAVWIVRFFVKQVILDRKQRASMAEWDAIQKEIKAAMESKDQARMTAALDWFLDKLKRVRAENYY